MWKFIGASALIIALILSGCGKNANNKSLDGASKGVDNADMQSHADNLYLPTPQSTMGEEVDKAREIIEMDTAYEPGKITVNGNTIWVTVYTTEKLSKNEKIKQEAALHKKVTDTVPGLNVNISIKER